MMRGGIGEAEVRAALEGAGLTIVKHRCEEEWHCYTCVAAQET